MAFRKIAVAGLELAAHANRRGAGLSLAFGGPLWRRFADWLRGGPPAVATPAAPSTSPVADAREGQEASDATPAAALQRQIAETTWYHTIDLGHGAVTPGQFDHQPLLHHYRLPESVAGLRVLDVAAFDGFWAFEFERRGAAEVVALDLDKPVQLDFPPRILATATAQDHEKKFGRGFEIASAALGSRVRRVTCSVYDLTPERYGLFDVVHAGDFLIHLNSPVKALQNIASVCRGYALISEVYSPELDRPGAGLLMEYRGGAQDVSWWKFSLETLEQMVLDAGFSRVERLARFRYGPRGRPQNMHHVVFKAFK